MMGTVVGVTVVANDGKALEGLVRGVFDEITRLESILSEWRPDSAVSAVNHHAGTIAIRVPTELVEVARVAEQVARATAGAFDCSWAALASSWAFDQQGFRLPDPAMVEAARQLVDYRDVVLDVTALTLLLRRKGMRLGLGGVAKTYIAERAADFALAGGAKQVLIDAGGDLVARGGHRQRPWTIGIRHPRVANALLAVAEIHDEAIATSGDYEQHVESGGRRYHHLLDPRTGYPASHSQSATVIARDGALADALATGLFVLGPQGLDLVSQFDGVAALVVGADGLPHVSCSGGARFELCR
jgi:thiamine biosynthesis lipoprotein